MTIHNKHYENEKKKVFKPSYDYRLFIDYSVFSFLLHNRGHCMTHLFLVLFLNKLYVTQSYRHFH